MTSRALISGPMAYLLKFMPRIFAVAVLLLAAAASAQAQERMGAVVMQDMLAGNTISGKTATGSNFSIYNNLNGKMSGHRRGTPKPFTTLGLGKSRRTASCAGNGIDGETAHTNAIVFIAWDRTGSEARRSRMTEAPFSGFAQATPKG